MAQNPPWADKIIGSHWDSVSAGAKRLKLPMPKSEISKKKHKPVDELGCAHYGCVWRSEQSGIVVKLTTDQTEAHTIASMLYLKEKNGFDPEGIVKYYAVFALPEQHRGRPVFVLWREEADKVGLPFDSRDPELRDFGKYLSRFKTLAHEARMLSIKKMKDIESKMGEGLSLRQEIDRIKSWGDGSNYMIKPLEKKLAKILAKTGSEDPMEAYWSWVKSQTDLGDEMAREYSDHWGETAEDPRDYSYGADRILLALQKRHKGWPNRFAWLIEACNQIAYEMANQNQYTYLVGRALNEFIDEGLLLADVHHNNVGVVPREDYSQGLWAITDPGHAIVLKKELSAIEIPTL